MSGHGTRDSGRYCNRALLRDAIRESGRIGIGKIILREAQHLAALEVIEDAIVLTMMRYADELADLSSFSFPSSQGLRKPELAMARQLIDHLGAEWDPEKYTDDYQANLMKVIQAKLKGRKPRLQEPVDKRQANVVDLMERLRASLAGKDVPETSRRRTASKAGGARRAPSKSVRRPARRVA